MAKTSHQNKLRHVAQGAAGAGWNKHVSPNQRLTANKVIRRVQKAECKHRAGEHNDEVDL